MGDREASRPSPTAKRGPGRPVDDELADRRRRQIIEAAYAVFAEHGYHNAGITEIMQQAQLGRGTFYLYFDNKRDILDGVIDYIIGRILEAVAADMTLDAAQGKVGLEQLIRKIADNLFALLDEHPDLTAAVVRNGTIDEAITRRMFGFADVFTATVKSFVQRAINGGALNRSLDPDAAALLLTGFALGGLLRGMRGDFSVDQRNRYVDTAIEMLHIHTV